MNILIKLFPRDLYQKHIKTLGVNRSLELIFIVLSTITIVLPFSSIIIILYIQYSGWKRPEVSL